MGADFSKRGKKGSVRITGTATVVYETDAARHLVANLEAAIAPAEGSTTGVRRRMTAATLTVADRDALERVGEFPLPVNQLLCFNSK